MRDMHQMNSAEANQLTIEQNGRDVTLSGVEDHSDSSNISGGVISLQTDHINLAGHVGLADNILVDAESDSYSLSIVDGQATLDDSYSEDSLDDVESIVEEKLSQDSLDDPLGDAFQTLGEAQPDDPLRDFFCPPGDLTETAAWDSRNTTTLHKDTLKYNTQINEPNTEIVIQQAERLPSFSSLNNTEEQKETPQNNEGISNLTNNVNQDSLIVPGSDTDTNGNSVDLSGHNPLVDSLEGPLDDIDDSTVSTETDDIGADKPDNTAQLENQPKPDIFILQENTSQTVKNDIAPADNITQYNTIQPGFGLDITPQSSNTAQADTSQTSKDNTIQPEGTTQDNTENTVTQYDTFGQQDIVVLLDGDNIAPPDNTKRADITVQPEHITQKDKDSSAKQNISAQPEITVHEDSSADSNKDCSTLPRQDTSAQRDNTAQPDRDRTTQLDRTSQLDNRCTALSTAEITAPKPPDPSTQPESTALPVSEANPGSLQLSDNSTLTDPNSNCAADFNEKVPSVFDQDLSPTQYLCELNENEVTNTLAENIYVNTTTDFISLSESPILEASADLTRNTEVEVCHQPHETCDKSEGSTDNTSAEAQSEQPSTVELNANESVINQFVEDVSNKATSGCEINFVLEQPEGSQAVMDANFAKLVSSLPAKVEEDGAAAAEQVSDNLLQGQIPDKVKIDYADNAELIKNYSNENDSGIDGASPVQDKLVSIDEALGSAKMDVVPVDPVFNSQDEGVLSGDAVLPVIQQVTGNVSIDNDDSGLVSLPNADKFNNEETISDDSAIATNDSNDATSMKDMDELSESCPKDGEEDLATSEIDEKSESKEELESDLVETKDEAPKNETGNDEVFKEKSEQGFEQNGNAEPEDAGDSSQSPENSPKEDQEPKDKETVQGDSPKIVTTSPPVFSCESNQTETITFGISTGTEDTQKKEPEEDPYKDLPVITYTVTSNVDEEPNVPKPWKKPGTLSTIKNMLSVLFSKRKKRRLVVNAEGQMVEEEYEVVVDAQGNEVEVTLSSAEVSPVVEKRKSLGASSESINKSDNEGKNSDKDASDSDAKAKSEAEAKAERKRKLKEAGTKSFFASIFNRSVSKEETASKEGEEDVKADSSESENKKGENDGENENKDTGKTDEVGKVGEANDSGEGKSESAGDSSKDGGAAGEAGASVTDGQDAAKTEKPKFKTLAKKSFFARLFNKSESLEGKEDAAQGTDENADKDGANKDGAESQDKDVNGAADEQDGESNKDKSGDASGNLEGSENSGSTATVDATEGIDSTENKNQENTGLVGEEDNLSVTAMGGDAAGNEGELDKADNESKDVDEGAAGKGDKTEKSGDEADKDKKAEGESKVDAGTVFKVGFFASLFKKKLNEAPKKDSDKDPATKTGDKKGQGDGEDGATSNKTFTSDMAVAVDKNSGRIFVPKKPVVENLEDMKVELEGNSMRIINPNAKNINKTDDKHDTDKQSEQDTDKQPDMTSSAIDQENTDGISNDYELDIDDQSDMTFDDTVDQQLSEKFYKSINEEGIFYEGDGPESQDCVPQPHVFEPDSEMFNQAETMRKQLQEGETEIPAPMESDDGSEGTNFRITLEAMGLKIGDRVIVGGVKSGILRFCGTTQFAHGLWAGIELDEPAGKNDGSVSGTTYFKCSPKHGIFAPVTKICKEGTQFRSPSQRYNIDHGLIDTSHVTAKVDTGLSRRKGGSANHPGVGEALDVGERVLVAGQRKGVIKFAGQTHFAPGWWYGIELDRPVGKNDGSVNGTRYFTCKPKHGVFAPQSRVQRIPHKERKNSEDLIDQRRLTGVNSESDSSHGAKKQNTRPKSSSSSRSSSKQYPVQTDAFTLQKGMSVFCNNELGTLRYIGPVDFADGIWLGLELRTPKGKNDGSVQGKRYFTCQQNYGVLVRPSKVTCRGINGAKLLESNAT